MTELTAVREAVSISVPTVNMIVEIVSVLIMFGVGIAALIVIHDHVRDWLYPAVVGFLFYMTLVYIMEQSAKIGFSFFASKNEWAAAHLDWFTGPILFLVVLGNVLALTVGMLYWRKQAMKTARPFALGGAIAFGFSFYLAAVFTNGALSQSLQMFTNSLYINEAGMSETISAYIEQGVDAATAEDALMKLTDLGHVVLTTLVPALTTVLSGITAVAAAVLFYGVLDGSLKKRWTLAVIGLTVLPYLPSIVALFTSGDVLGYVFFAYDILLAAGAALLAVQVLRKQMPDDLDSLAYSRRKEKREKEKAAKKMPKIEMPKD